MVMNDEGNGVRNGEGKDAASVERRLRILVVDDDQEVATSIVRALESLGHAAARCGHAQDAMEVIGRHEFDLLLVDYRMPDMTGLDLIALLREDGCKTPVLMMTGHFATEDRVPAEQLGIHAILRKPLTLPILSHALAEPRMAARETV